MNSTALVGAALAISLGSLATPARADTFVATNYAELVAAINAANANGGADTISISGDITLAGLLPAITGATVVNGGSFTISGGDQTRLFFVDAGGQAVVFNDMVMADGRAAGGAGGQGGGGGGMGAGGAIFVNAGAVTASNVSFTGNDAVGGAGAILNANGSGAGGGGGLGGSGGQAGNAGGGGGGYSGGGGGGGSQIYNGNPNGGPAGVGGAGPGGAGGAGSANANGQAGENGGAGGALVTTTGGATVNYGGGGGGGGTNGGAGGNRQGGGGGGAGYTGAGGVGGSNNAGGTSGGIGGGGGGSAGAGVGGNGGDFAGGGGGYYAFNAGAGGFGGGGAGGYGYFSGGVSLGSGGDGGFGGGGGAAGGSQDAGTGGVGAGSGTIARGGGGAGLGGAVFVRPGGAASFNMVLGATGGVTGGSATGGSSTVAGVGAGAGAGLFLASGGTTTLTTTSGVTSNVQGIADDSARGVSGGAYTAGTGAGADITVGGTGTLALSGTGGWGGVTTVNSGATLQGGSQSISGGSIVTNGVLSYVQSTSGTVTQAISGTGQINVSGLGAGQALTFTGALTNSNGIDLLDGSAIVIGNNLSATSGPAVNSSAAGVGITNLGAMTGNAGSPFGTVNLTAGGTVINGSVANSTASITGSYAAIYNTGGALNITNYGTLSGGYGIVAQGGNGANPASLTLVNSGTIRGTDGAVVANDQTVANSTTNSATGLIQGNNIGVVLRGTASLNNAGDIVGGTTGVLLFNTNTNSLTNSGRIASGTITGSGAGGVITVGGGSAVEMAGGTVNNLAGAQILGNTAGINSSAGTLSVTNAGSITGATGSSNGIASSGTLNLVNQNGGLITGGGASGSAVFSTGANASIINQNGGRLIGFYGIVTGGAGGVINNSGLIRGFDDAVILSGATALTNNTGGLIVGAGNEGIFVNANGSTIINAGLIVNAATGIGANFVVAITNSGTIASGAATDATTTSDQIMRGAGAAIALGAGGSVTNLAGGQIFGGLGILINNGATGAVSNSGVINANGALLTSYGVSLTGANSTLGNLAGGTISSDNGDAVRSTGANVVMTNAGLISGGGFGLNLSGGGTITNRSGGSIAGTLGAINLSGASGYVLNLDAGSTTGAITASGNGARQIVVGGALNGAYNAASGTGVDNFTLAATGSMTSASLGAGNDSFTFQGGAFSGLIDGGSGSDNFITALGAGSATLNLNNVAAFEILTHQSGAVTLTGSGPSLTSIIAGAGTPSGRLILDGTTGLTSAITVNGATIRAATAGAFGTGTITMIDPTIEYGATGIYANNIVLSVVAPASADPSTFNTDAGVVATLTGSITQGGGDAVQPVVIGGSGTIVLTNTANSWTGSTTINAGATLQGASNTISGGSVVNNGVLAFDQATAGSFAAGISGSGVLNILGSGALTLSGTNTYTGATNINAGALIASGGAAIGDSSAVTVASGGTLTLAGSETIGSLAGSGSVNLGANTLTVGGDNTSTEFSGVISDMAAGPLTYIGSWNVSDGPSWPAGPPTYTGQEAAALLFGRTASDYRISTAGSNVAAVNDLTWYDRYAASYVELAADWRVDTNGAGYNTTNDTSAYVRDHGGTHINYAFAQALASAGGGLTHIGTGRLILSGANTYTGLTSVLGGTLELRNGAAIMDTGVVSIASGAALVVTDAETIGGLTGAGALVLDETLTVANGSGVYSGGAGGAGGLIVSGGSLTLGGTLTQAAGTTVSNGADVTLTGAASNNGTVVTVTGTGSSLIVGASGSINATGGAPAVVVATADADVTNSGTIQSAGTGVRLTAGGALINNAGGVITGGDYGVQSGGGLLVTNGGSISGLYDGLNILNGSALTLTNTGSITANLYGAIYSTGAITITNSGALTGGSDTGAGLGVNVDGGALNLTNLAGGQITGAAGGVRHNTTSDGLISNAGVIGSIVTFNTGSLTLNNLAGGTVQGQFSAVDSQQGGRLIIDNAGTITGGNWGIVSRNATDSITNSGTITGTSQQGVIMSGGTLTNQATGVINAGTNGVQLAGAALVSNAGQIHGGVQQFQHGLIAGTSGSTLTNLSGGVIDGWRGVVFNAGGVVSNSGTISGLGAEGVSFFGGSGSVTNNAGAVISGATNGVYSAANTPLTVNNAGLIRGGSGQFQQGVNAFGANSTVTNSAGGLIDGWRGVTFGGGATGASVVNAGTITGTGDNAVSLFSGGLVDNRPGGVLNATSNGGWGVYAIGGAISVTNAGLINADSGVVFNSNGFSQTLSNSGSITGLRDGVMSLSGGVSITNAGSITATSATLGRGIALVGAGSVITNQTGGAISGWRGVELATGATGAILGNAGTISGLQQGVYSNAAGVLINNTGTISASAGQGVYLNAGGSLTNSGLITGSNHAFVGAGGASNVANLVGGVMTGTTFNAVYTGGAGSIITNAGLMNGGNAGVYTDGADTSLTNSGTIRVTGTTAPTVISGVYMAGAGSSVTNSGLIESTLTDGRGVFLSGGTGSITNQTGGVISGNGAGAAIILTGADYALDLQTGSTVNGLIDASASTGANTLSLAGTLNGGYVGGTGADDVTLFGGASLTGFLIGGDGVDSLVLAGSGDGTLDASLTGGFESRTLNGTGSWTLSGTDGDTSDWTLNAGELRLTGGQSVNNLAGIAVNAGSVLSVIDSEAIGALTGAGSVVINDAQALVVGADDGSSTFDGVISGLGGLQHVGAGTLTLTGANTYSGLTLVQTGTLQLGASGVIADASDTMVLTGATLDLQGFDETVRSLLLNGTLAGTGTLTAGQYQLDGATVNANLGGGDLFNTGGVSTLNGTAGAGLVSVQAGTLTLGASDRLADTATVSVTSGATFDLGAYDDTVALALLNGTLAGTGTLTASQYQLNGATVNANLGGGDLFNTGGVSTLNGVSGAGLVSVQAGTLTLGASDRLADAALVSVASDATFDLGAFNDTVALALLNGTLAGTGTLTAGQYQLNGATVNANLGMGDLFNTGGVSTLNGTSGAGLVSVQAGTLTLGASDRLADTATVSVASGATFDLGAFNDTVSLALLNGTLAGTGTLTAGQYQLNGATVNANLGAGDLFNVGGVSTLNGTAGAARIWLNAGTLRLGASGRLADTATVSVATGATFALNGFDERIGALFGTGDVNVGPGRLTFGGTESGFGGRLSGTGSLVHTGGLFTLLGDHTIRTISNTGGELRFLGSTTGNMSISGGSLTGAGTIGGALTASNGAILSPGLAGVQNGIGGFTAGSLTVNGATLAIDVLGRSGGSLIDQLRINGTATLTGGLLSPTFHGGAADFDFSTRYLFLQANNLVGTFANGGVFTAAAQDGLFWRVRYDLAPNTAVLELRELTDFDPGLTGSGNERAVGRALSEGQLEASDDFAGILSLIAGLDDAGRTAAFNSISGESLAGMSTSLLSASDSFLSSVRDGGLGARSDGGALNFAGQMGSSGRRDSIADRVGAVISDFDPSASAARGAGGWVAAYAADQTLEGKAGTADLDSRLNGFGGGYGVRNGAFSIGGAAGVTRLEGEVVARQAHYESDLSHAAAYVSFDDGAWAADVTASIYGGDLDSRRGVTVGTFTGQAIGNTHAEGQAISASVARRFQVADNTMIALGAVGTASNASVDGFTETGAGGLSLEASGLERDWQSLLVSARGTQDYRVDGRRFRIHAGAGVLATTGDRQASGDMRFTGASTGFGAFTVEAAETPPVAGVADFGLEVGVGEGLTLSAGYRGVFGDRLRDNQVGIQLKANW